MTFTPFTCVIFDWAGTTVDYGCFAPLHAFLDIFKSRGIDISPAEARGPMGLPKHDHVRALCALPRIQSLWQERFGRLPDDNDVDALYADFEPSLFSTLSRFCDPIPGVIDCVSGLRAMGLRIGSTTGYTRDMMDIVERGARDRGYAPDCLVTPNDVPSGRPAPWMIYRCCEILNIWPLSRVLKVGDTLSDIAEARNASVTAVAVILGSNELGLTEAEVAALPSTALAVRKHAVRERYFAAGAHHVLDSISELPSLIQTLNAKL
jgi:phosphonoacetaldehyde hydrolase